MNSMRGSMFRRDAGLLLVRYYVFRIIAGLLFISAPVFWFLVDRRSLQENLETVEQANAWFNMSHGGALALLILGIMFACGTKLSLRMQAPIFGVLPFALFLSIDLAEFHSGGYNPIGMDFILIGCGVLSMLMSIPLFWKGEVFGKSSDAVNNDKSELT